MQRIGALPAGYSGQELSDFLRANAPKCNKCGRVIVSVTEVTRKGKYGQLYRYVRLRHHDARKSDGRAYCYVRIEEDSSG